MCKQKKLEIFNKSETTAQYYCRRILRYLDEKEKKELKPCKIIKLNLNNL